LGNAKTPNVNKEVLYDTARSVNGMTRGASQVAFVPIGHISLDPWNKDAERLGIDLPSEGVFWIKSFFILQSLQGGGIGRAAMDAVEDMAAREPLWAQTLMLDTVTKAHQTREDFALSTYGSIPKVRRYTRRTFQLFIKPAISSQITNEAWYSRRGYEPVITVPNYYDVWDGNGNRWDIEIVFMRKDIQ
jgi:GNAT superfamily N-acetyltransferase